MEEASEQGEEPWARLWAACGLTTPPRRQPQPFRIYETQAYLLLPGGLARRSHLTWAPAM